MICILLIRKDRGLKDWAIGYQKWWLGELIEIEDGTDWNRLLKSLLYRDHIAEATSSNRIL